MLWQIAVKVPPLQIVIENVADRQREIIVTVKTNITILLICEVMCLRLKLRNESWHNNEKNKDLPINHGILIQNLQCSLIRIVRRIVRLSLLPYCNNILKLDINFNSRKRPWSLRSHSTVQWTIFFELSSSTKGKRYHNRDGAEVNLQVLLMPSGGACGNISVPVWKGC